MSGNNKKQNTMETIENEETWVVEYNSRQNRFHTQELNRTLQDNLALAKVSQDNGGWHVIGIFQDHIKAGDFIQEIRKGQNLF